MRGSQRGILLTVLGLIAATFLARLWWAQTFELTGRESYLWMLSQPKGIAFGYWDSGVLTPWLIWLGTEAFGDSELGIRWLGVAIYALTSLLIYVGAKSWFNKEAGLACLIAFLVTPMFCWKLILMTEVSTGLGLMAGALFAYRKAIKYDLWYWWALSGIATGLALHVSWFTAIWPIGLLCFFLSEPRHRWRLLGWKPWAVAVITALFALPIFLYYQSPQLIGLSHSSQTAFALARPFDFDSGAGFLKNQIFLLSPGVFLGLLVALFFISRLSFTHHRYALLVWISLPGLIAQGIASFFRVDDPQMMPALYLPLILLAANMWSSFSKRYTVWQYSGLAIVVMAGLQSILGLHPATNHYLGPGSGIYKTYSYSELAEELDRKINETGAQYVMTEGKYTASAMNFYMANQDLAYVIDRPGIQSQYDFWTGYGDIGGNYKSLLILALGRPIPAIVKQQFESVTDMGPIELPDGRDSIWRFVLCFNYQGTPYHEEGLPAQDTKGEDLDLPKPDDSDAVLPLPEPAPGSNTPVPLPLPETEADLPAPESTVPKAKPLNEAGSNIPEAESVYTQ